MFELYMTLLNNLMLKECSSYETVLYQQLLITVKQRARLDELILQQAIEEQKNGKRSDQASRGTAQSDPQIEEHRGDGSAPAV